MILLNTFPGWSMNIITEIPKLEKAPRDDWYLRGMSCLRRLINILELPTAKIAEILKKRMANPESSYGALDVEESIVHFLRSWEIYKEKNVSLSGCEVETVLGK
jgi:hypothetical protein